MTDGLVLPEYGPTLPGILRRRFGWRERTTGALLVAAAALLGVALLVVRPQVDGVAKLVHRDGPVFDLLYDTGALRPVPPRAGELVRLEGRRGRLSVAITVERLRLPPATGDVAHGLLPVYASRHIQALRARLDGFQLRAEGRSRVKDAPGYEVRFGAGPPGRPTFGDDLMILPSDDATAGALLVASRRTIDGSLTAGARERTLYRASARAFRSFRYER